MPKPRTRALLLAELPPEATPTAAEVAAAIALRIRESLYDDKFARDRVRDRLRKHTKKGLIARASQDDYVAADVQKWAQKNWSVEFSDIPPAPSIARAVCSSIVTARGVSLPGDLERCHEAILAAGSRIASLESELATSQSKIAELEPLAEKYRSIQRANKKNAERRRK